MFPLKRRRKFARISKDGLMAKVSYESNCYEAEVIDVSASGCKLSLGDSDLTIPFDGIVRIDFTLNDKEFSFDATKVRANCYNFIFNDREPQTRLNNEILVEYFKDTPELIPVSKSK